MNHLLHGVARAITEAFELPGPVLEVGAFQVAGQEPISNLRGLLPGQAYTGIDLRPGPGVDRVADVEDLPFADASFGTVLACNVFEHVRHFWRGFDEIHRVLRPDGVLVTSVPFYFRLHDYPRDYWRFSAEGLDALLEAYPQRVLGWHGPAGRPLHVWALACREECLAITRQQFEHYQNLVARYAQLPRRRWHRRLRYRLLGLICGRGPFAPYLDRERCQSVLRQTTRASSFKDVSCPRTEVSAACG